MRIPGYLQLLREGRREEAAELVWLDNPLPASTGRVCQHPCEQRCRRADVDAAVNMREVHRHIADAMFAAFTDREIADRLARHRLAPTGHKMAVVGAGPAGLSAAFYLALLGHDVTVFDPKAEPGGMLRYSLPEYRLPKRVVDREINVIRGLGVRFVPNRTIRGDARDIEELEKKYIATFLAIGTWREQSARMPGEEAQGVFHAIDFLDRVATDRRPALGKRTLVIGGGNAAIDSARTALRLGSEVTVVYRRDRQDMPAIAEEVADAEAEGVRFLFYAAPERVLTDEQGRARALEVASMKAGEFDRTGRRKPVATGGRQSLECDSVILAIGERPDARHFQEEIIAIREDGTVDADRLSGRTDRPHVYAGGDVVTGPTNVSRAMGSGRNAARSIDRRLMGEDRFGRILGEFGYASDVPLDPLGGERNVATHLPAETRRHQFVEVVQGFSAETAARECLRCLRCDVKE
jgi:NADH-quinone oxidoreductase subunit F